MANVINNENGNPVENKKDFVFNVPSHRNVYVYFDDEKELRKAEIIRCVFDTDKLEMYAEVSINGSTHIFESFENIYLNENCFKNEEPLNLVQRSVTDICKSAFEHLKCDNAGLYVWIFNEEIGRADKWYILDHVNLFQVGNDVKFKCLDVVPERTYFSSSDVYKYNTYITEENGKRTKHIGAYGLLQLDEDQKELVKQLDKLLTKMKEEDIDIRYSLYDYDGIVCFNRRYIEDFGCVCPDTETQYAFEFNSRYLPKMSQVQDFNDECMFAINKDRLTMELE